MSLPLQPRIPHFPSMPVPARGSFPGTSVRDGDDVWQSRIQAPGLDHSWYAPAHDKAPAHVVH
jgi:hypothetical protein